VGKGEGTQTTNHLIHVYLIISFQVSISNRRLGICTNLYSRPLHTHPKSRDHETMRAQKEVSKGRPKTLPKPCIVVTDPLTFTFESKVSRDVFKKKMNIYIFF
jgi:hypothetical protein